jgi:hypothetical protein
LSSSYVTEHHDTANYGDVNYRSVHCYTRKLAGVSGELHVTLALLPGKELSLPVGYEAGSKHSHPGRCAKEKNLCLRRKSNPHSAASQPITVVTTVTELAVPARPFIYQHLISAKETTRFSETRSIQFRKSSILWAISLCSLLKYNRRFRATCNLHIQGEEQANNVIVVEAVRK